MSTTSPQDAIDAINDGLAFEPTDLGPVTLWARISNGDSDVLFGKRHGEAVCLSCLLVADGQGIYITERVQDAQAHLRRHRKAKHLVPEGLEEFVGRNWSSA